MINANSNIITNYVISLLFHYDNIYCIQDFLHKMYMYILVCSGYVQELERQVAKLLEEFPTYSKAVELTKDAPTCLTGDLPSLDKETLVHNRHTVVSTSIECMNITSYSKVSYDSRYSQNPLYSSADHLQLVGNSNYGNRCRPIIYYFARFRHII